MPVHQRLSANLNATDTLLRGDVNKNKLLQRAPTYNINNNDIVNSSQGSDNESEMSQANPMEKG